jgi:hypothetical protein
MNKYVKGFMFNLPLLMFILIPVPAIIYKWKISPYIIFVLSFTIIFSVKHNSNLSWRTLLIIYVTYFLFCVCDYYFDIIGFIIKKVI